MLAGRYLRVDDRGAFIFRAKQPKDTGITQIRNVSNYQYIPVEEHQSEKDLDLKFGFFFMRVLNVFARFSMFMCFSMFTCFSIL